MFQGEIKRQSYLEFKGLKLSRSAYFGKMAQRGISKDDPRMRTANKIIIVNSMIMRGLNLCLAASKCTRWKQGQIDVNALFVTYECYEGQAKAISY